VTSTAVSTAELQADTLRRGTKVRLVDATEGYPAGAKGRIAVANGMTWRRYWVRMQDGEAIGHVDHGSLVRAGDYEQFLAAKEREAAEAEQAALEAAAAEEAAEDAPAAATGAAGGGTVVNGVAIPQRLLDMSAAARARLGA